MATSGKQPAAKMIKPEADAPPAKSKVPTLLGGIAAVITAVAGLVLAFNGKTPGGKPDAAHSAKATNSTQTPPPPAPSTSASVSVTGPGSFGAGSVSSSTIVIGVPPAATTAAASAAVPAPSGVGAAGPAGSQKVKQ